MRIKKSIISILLILGIVISENLFYELYMVNANEISEVKKEIKTNINPEKFSSDLPYMENFGQAVNTYLNKTDNGYEVVFVSDKIYIVNYDNNWNVIGNRELDFELPIFGAFYYGEKYNYVVCGQQAGSKETKEAYRVIKYDKDFNRLDALSISNDLSYTAWPFLGGDIAVAENNGELIIYTARNRYDGHQSNILFRININSMRLMNSSQMGEFPDIHVSHSMRNVVRYDGGKPILATMGDAYPRNVCIQDTYGTRVKVLGINGEIGDNKTDTDLSDFEVTKDSYLLAGAQKRNGCNNIYISSVDKDLRRSDNKLTWLTNYTSDCEGVCNTKISKIDDGKYAVMWNNFSYGGSLQYVMVDDSGNVISELKTVNGIKLTQCDPILDNGKLEWISYIDGKAELFRLSDFSCNGSYRVQDTYVNALNPWDGSIDTGWYIEEKNEFNISTAQQLAGLAKLVNDGNTFEGKRVVLTSDIFLNDDYSKENVWYSIASVSSGVQFQGTFNGSGHTIYNGYTINNEEGGLFGVIGENGIVKAVSLKQGTYIGESIAYINNGWIIFCENISCVQGLRDTYYISCAGGICYENRNLIYGCGNKGSVEGSPAGAIATKNTENAIIDSCWNNGVVIGSSGIVSNNEGWVTNCYNSGQVGTAGIAEDMRDWNMRVINCYNAGSLVKSYYDYNYQDTIGNYHGTNVYSATEYCNSSYTTVVSMDELKSSDMISRIKGDDVLNKWCLDEHLLNKGLMIPLAQDDLYSGEYKVLPVINSVKDKVTVNISDDEYQLEGIIDALYGTKKAEPVYDSESKNISITSDGKIIPKKAGTAIVKVTLPETENTKEYSFDISVTINGLRGDLNDDGKVTMSDLVKCVQGVSGRIILIDQETWAADVDENGKVDIRDATRLLYFVSGRNANL